MCVLQLSPVKRVACEVGLCYVTTTVIAATLYRVGALQGYYSAIVAALLLYVPFFVLRKRPLELYGLTARPLGSNLALFLGVSALVLPLFAVGYAQWAHLACDIDALHQLVPSTCPPHFVLRLPPQLGELALGQLIGVALPEEFFFRGFVQGRLSDVWQGRKLLGAPVGPLFVTAALFAICHLAVQGHPGTLAVFFPGLLFGWMRAKTGSIASGTLFHALCNLTMDTLQRSFFG